jgi:hypothetical protein
MLAQELLKIVGREAAYDQAKTIALERLPPGGREAVHPGVSA